MLVCLFFPQNIKKSAKYLLEEFLDARWEASEDDPKYSIAQWPKHFCWMFFILTKVSELSVSLCDKICPATHKGGQRSTAVGETPIPHCPSLPEASQEPPRHERLITKAPKAWWQEGLWYPLPYSVEEKKFSFYIFYLSANLQCPDICFHSIKAQQLIKARFIPATINCLSRIGALLL